MPWFPCARTSLQAACNRPRSNAPRLRVFVSRVTSLSALGLALTCLAPAPALFSADDIRPLPPELIPAAPPPAGDSAPAPAPLAGPALTIPPAHLSDALYAQLKPLVEQLNDLNRAVVADARRACVELSARHKAELWAGLRDADPLKRRLALRLLPYFGEAARVAAAAGALLSGPRKDSDKAIRLAAATVLFNLPDPAGFNAAVNALTQDEEPELRAAVAQALGQFNDDRAIEPLLGALTDVSALVRGNAAQALAHLNRPTDRVLEKLRAAQTAEADPVALLRLEKAWARLQAQTAPSPPAPASPSSTSAAPAAAAPIAPLDVLDQLANDMGAIEARLRNDQQALARNPQAVEDEAHVVDEFDTLIDRLRTEPPPPPDPAAPTSKKPSPPAAPASRPARPSRPTRRNAPAVPAGPAPRQPGSPALRSGLPTDTTRYGALGAAPDVSQSGIRGLPPHPQQALDGLRSQELPEQWTGVLASYWLSVNQIEAQENAAADR